ncbi:alpha/beta hydrolase [Leptolyngbya sp. FACHB-541]|uniref:alpha/beta fold hydrolase n=1 Tax=Leptolyngbya sp. FACHB-541 TaxID=2692810 RepID=UPI0016893BB1|nr:alpha/beta hydrolase [Leptolyngbya sp. FACHB-541]MBD1998814.1 alpha/beta hydrolase [Leptolyngbya sp. FACHB-541]
MSCFLLIHGNRHGKWAWDKVVGLLENRGHEAYAIDLPGHGDDPTPRERINLQTYRNAVIQYVEEHNFNNLILVGHSAGGMVLAAVAKALCDRLSGMVFIAALVPEQGESQMDYVSLDQRDAYLKMAQNRSDYSIPISYEQARERYFDEFSDTEAHLFFSKLTPEPFGAMTSKVEDDELFQLQIPMLYILCRNDQALPIETCRACARKLKATIIELWSGHDVMLSHPEELVKILETF